MASILEARKKKSKEKVELLVNQTKVENVPGIEEIVLASGVRRRRKRAI